jgi:hypothetical protein
MRRSASHPIYSLNYIEKRTSIDCNTYVSLLAMVITLKQRQRPQRYAKRFSKIGESETYLLSEKLSGICECHAMQSSNQHSDHFFFPTNTPITFVCLSDPPFKLANGRVDPIHGLDEKSFLCPRYRCFRWRSIQLRIAHHIPHFQSRHSQKNFDFRRVLFQRKAEHSMHSYNCRKFEIRITCYSSMKG